MTLTVTRHPKDNKSKVISPFPRQDAFKTRKNIKLCIPKQRPTQNPHKQWEVYKTINQQQQNHRHRTDSS